MKLCEKADITFKVSKAIFFKKKFPLSVYLHITDRCPLNCRYCAISMQPRNELSTREIFDLIEQIQQSGAMRLHINGGEPLMREDIGEVINYAKKKKLYISMSSNGYLLSQRIKQLNNLDIIFLSFDGPEKIHDNQRGEGSYTRVTEAFDLCQKYGIKFWTTTVLTKNNINSIDFILDMAEKFKFAANFHILNYTLGYHYKTLPISHPLQSLLLTKEQYQGVFRKLIRAKKKGMPVVNSLKFFEYLLDWDDYAAVYTEEEKNGVKCWAGKLYCWVDIDGSVYPCYDCIGKTVALNFLEVGFQNAFYNMEKGYCRSCIIPCYLEMNLMFSLNLGTIFNYLKIV